MSTNNNRLDLMFGSPGFRPDVLPTAYQNKPDYRLEKTLNSRAGCKDLLNDLLETSPADLEGKDIALLNLLCAPTIKGAEDLQIPRSLQWLDGLTSRVKGAIDRNVYRFREDPDYGNCLPKWMMSMLVTVIKRSYGAVYNPEIAAACHASTTSPMDNARDVFLNGLLDENRNRRHGTCASFPVLIASIARRLGYPVGIAVAGRHIFARWEGDGVRFNVEATGPMGMTINSDEKYREDHVADEHKNHPYFIRTLSAAEEFGLFMTFRVECLVLAERYDETLLWTARAMQFAPDDPAFVPWAIRGANNAMRNRFKRANPTVKMPRIGAADALDFNVGPLLHESERSSYLTIIGHLDEHDGDLSSSRERYEEACRLNFHGNNEQRDLQRFLKKYNQPRHPRPLLPPKNLLHQRRFKLLCQPHEEASLLRQMANEFYRNGEYLKSRNALEDLYMFDPGDAEVFQAARKITAMPEFQTQLKAAMVEQRREQN